MVAMDTYGPFDSGAGANITEDTWRAIMRTARGYRSASRSGVIRDIANALEVYDDGSGMQVKVRTGQVWVEGHWGEVTAEKTVPIASNSSGLARKDRVVARVDFLGNSVDVDVLTGTPAASPSAPAVTQDSTKWEISLAIVDVPSGDTSISGQTTDARNYLDQPFVSKQTNASVVVNNSTALTTITELTMPVSASRQYALEGYIIYSSATAADAKLQINGPTNATARITTHALDTAAASAIGTRDATAHVIATPMSLGGVGTGTTVAAHLVGRFSTSDTAGNLTVQWAQLTANASDTTLLLGSWIKLTPLS